MKHTHSLLTLFCVTSLSGFLFAETPVSSVAELQLFVDKQELAGAVALVADKNRVVSVEAVGFADVKRKQAMKPDALFWPSVQTFVTNVDS